MNFIEVKDVVKQYSGHLALDHVSLNVAEGCIYGLLGPNGAGKTSLIRILNQITTADSGEILINGRRTTADDVAKIGYLPEERGLYKKMKVGEQIVYLGRLKGMSRTDATQEMERWLERFGLSEWRNKKLEALSKGMAQKVQFIATVLHRPKLLIFDEPFSGFDPVNTEQLKQEIIGLGKEGATILFSTHNMGSVEEVCEEITLINRAKVVLQGRVSDIRRQYKKNLYTLHVNDNEFESDAKLYSIETSDTLKDGGVDATIRLNEGVSLRDTISVLNEKYELTGIQELLPSMHEVFIETVTDKNE